MTNLIWVVSLLLGFFLVLVGVWNAYLIKFIPVEPRLPMLTKSIPEARASVVRGYALKAVIWSVTGVVLGSFSLYKLLLSVPAINLLWLLPITFGLGCIAFGVFAIRFVKPDKVDQVVAMANDYMTALSTGIMTYQSRNELVAKRRTAVRKAWIWILSGTSLALLSLNYLLG